MRKQIYKTIICITIISVFIVLCVNICYADHNPACRFAGTITVGDAEIPGGTRITAVIEGDEYHTHTPLEGSTNSYSITITPGDGIGYQDGALVSFHIEGYPTNQTGIYIAGTNVNLNLAAVSYELGIFKDLNSTYPNASLLKVNTTFPWWIIIATFISIIFISSLTYYSVLLRRAMKRTAERNAKLLHMQ